MQLADSLQLWAPGASEVIFDPKLPLIQLMKGTELYRTCWALEAVIGKEMARQMTLFPPSKVAAKSLCRPTFVACGDQDAFLGVSINYHKHCPSEPKAFIEIKGAGHQFNEGDTALELYEKSLEFIRGLK
jgi:pimeloyl-ACP methyl ester carboxylesterase